MMKLFDFHGDIGYAIMKQRKCTIFNSLTNEQLPKRKAGGFSWVCMASYFEGNESWNDMQEMILALQEEIDQSFDIRLVKDKDDLTKEALLHAICTVEGMCGIQSDVEEKIDWLHDHHIKIASFAWNDENALATGVRGNSNRGLSELGIQALKRMQQHNMIIDVSHANEKTFWDIMENCNDKVMATHSNARALCDHPRNLYDEQLFALCDRGGLVSVVCAGAFVHPQREHQTIASLVHHMQYLKTKIGVAYIALGLDFMDDYDGATETMLTDLKEPSNAQKIIQEMKTQGFSRQEIVDIAYGNALRYLYSYL